MNAAADTRQHSQPASSGTRGGKAKRRRVAIAFIAPAVFVAIVVFLAVALGGNPRDLPSALLGKSVPAFALSPVKGRTLGLSTADLKGKVSLVNVFASWCAACRDEHLVFMRSRRGASFRSTASTTRTGRRTPPAGSISSGIRTHAPGPTSRAAWPSNGAFTACLRRSLSIGAAGSSSSMSGRSRPRYSKRRSFHWCEGCGGDDGAVDRSSSRRSFAAMHGGRRSKRPRSPCGDRCPLKRRQDDA